MKVDEPWFRGKNDADVIDTNIKINGKQNGDLEYEFTVERQLYYIKDDVTKTLLLKTKVTKTNSQT